MQENSASVIIIAMKQSKQQQRNRAAHLEAAVVVSEELDPAGAGHGLGAHHTVLAAGVPHLY